MTNVLSCNKMFETRTQLQHPRQRLTLSITTAY